MSFSTPPASEVRRDITSNQAKLDLEPLGSNCNFLQSDSSGAQACEGYCLLPWKLSGTPRLSARLAEESHRTTLWFHFVLGVAEKLDLTSAEAYRFLRCYVESGRPPVLR
jgi:hypothetical protein